MKTEIVKYVANNLVGMGDYIRICLRTMEEWRCGLTDEIEGAISDAISDYILDNDLAGTDAEDELWQLDYEELFYDALDILED